MSKDIIKPKFIEARDIPDLWFQAVSGILKEGREFKVDEGSFEDGTRLEYDYFIGLISDPGGGELLPVIPSHLGIPSPVEHDYIFGGEGYDRSYVEYLMSDRKEPGESYTYGERLTKEDLHRELQFMWYKDDPNIQRLYQNGSCLFSKEGKVFINQIEWIIKKYKRKHRNNQLVLQIARPSDIVLKDPPCLRHIDTRVQDNRLIFFVYFRSWDLWGGLPANLAAIQILKKYMADEIGVEDGEMIVESKGLHIYSYAKKLAKIRCYVDGEKC